MVSDRHPFRVVLGRAYHGLPCGSLLLQNFSVAMSASSFLFYLSFNFVFYESKIMHLGARILSCIPNN